MIGLLAWVVAIGGAQNRPLAEVLLFCAVLYSAILLLTYPQIRALVGWQRPVVMVGILGALCGAWLVARNNLLPDEPEITLAKIEETVKKAIAGTAKEQRRPPSVPILEPTQTVPPEPQTTEPADSPAPKDAPLTPRDIVQQIDAAPFLMRDEVANSFLGISLTCQISLFSIEEGEEEGTIEIFGAYDPAHYHGAVGLTAIVENSSRFAALREGALLTISGRIVEVRAGRHFHLSPATVDSIESYGRQ